MNDVQRALAQISSIRAQLAANSRFWRLSPGCSLIMGVLSLGVAVGQGLFTPVSDTAGFIVIWSALLFFSALTTGVVLSARTWRVRVTMLGAMLSSFMQKVFPFLAAIASVTWIVIQFAPDSVWVLPGLWQMLLGLLGFSILNNLPKPILWVSGWYFMCGVVVLAYAAQTQTLVPWMMGIPFTLGQAAVTGIMMRERKNQEGKQRVG